MSQQKEKVRLFFDKIAPEYAQRYTGANGYYDYFFNERLRTATDGLSYEGKTILDIGAGTGALYDFLLQQTNNVEYYATDISARMLAQSNIPKKRRFIGELNTVNLPAARFDYIFMLGVTSYMSREELIKTISYIQTHIAPSGYAVISFSNRCSLDFQCRKWMQIFLQLFTVIPIIRKRIIGQSFSIHGYCKKEVKEILFPAFRIHDMYSLNQTFTPWNQLLPSLSIRLAKLLRHNLRRKKLLSFFSADFLVRVGHVGGKTK